MIGRGKKELLELDTLLEIVSLAGRSSAIRGASQRVSPVFRVMTHLLPVCCLASIGLIACSEFFKTVRELISEIRTRVDGLFDMGEGCLMPAAKRATCILGLLMLAARPTPASDGRVLFNGKDLPGWVVEGPAQYKDHDGQVKPMWKVEDGLLVC